MNKKLLIILPVVVLFLSSCLNMPRVVKPSGGGALDEGVVIVVGKILIEPQPERGEKGMFNSGYDGQVRLFLDSIMKKETTHEQSFWESWPVQIEGYENDTFFYGVTNSRYYAVMAGYMLSRSTTYEMIHLPVMFPVDIQPGDKAVYIGTIKFTRDLFYNVKNVEIIDEYNSALSDFVKEYGKNVKLRKVLAKIKK